MDAYLDLAQIEGWGLPVGEAMACGLPVVGIRDHWVRDEVYGDARIVIDPIPQRLWPIHSTGAYLPKCDPVDVADALINLREDESRQKLYRFASLEKAACYKWEDSQAKMVDIIKCLS